MQEMLLKQDAIKNLAKSTDYRQFLLAIIAARESVHGRGTRAAISRRAGFSSRSYLTEVLNGKKGLSRDAMLRLKAALKLTGPLGKFFECLVELEYPEVGLKQTDKKILNERLACLRKELCSINEDQIKIAAKHLPTPEVFQIYASLGTETEGASFEEIGRKTRLSVVRIRQGLNQLIFSGAALQKKERYYPVATKADALNSQDQLAISQMIRKVSANIHKNSDQIAFDQSSLGVYSAFSVRREKLSDLRKSLQAAVFEVLDEYQDDSGDCVEQVFLSLFRVPFDSPQLDTSNACLTQERL